AADLCLMELANRMKISIETFSNSKSLKLPNNTTDLELVRAVQFCIHLTSLDFSWCDQITDEGIQLAAKYCPHLVSLNVEATGVRNLGLLSFIKNCSELAEIRVTKCYHINNLQQIIKTAINHNPPI